MKDYLSAIHFVGTSDFLKLKRVVTAAGHSDCLDVKGQQFNIRVLSGFKEMFVSTQRSFLWSTFCQGNKREPNKLLN